MDEQNKTEESMNDRDNAEKMTGSMAGGNQSKNVAGFPTSSTSSDKKVSTTGDGHPPRKEEDSTTGDGHPPRTQQGGDKDSTTGDGHPPRTQQGGKKDSTTGDGHPARTQEGGKKDSTTGDGHPTRTTGRQSPTSEVF